MRFCQSLITELYRHIGPNMDVPAGDIGVGAREIGYMFGQYKRITGEFSGVFTGKGLSYGGCPGRKEATGYGLCYFLDAMLKKNGHSLEGKKAVVSGSGNVALYAAKKAYELLGALPIAMSDSNGFVVDDEGIDIELMIDIKEKRRGRIKEYADAKNVPYVDKPSAIWEVPCDIALPCATQNELDEAGAKALVKNGVIAWQRARTCQLQLRLLNALRIIIYYMRLEKLQTRTGFQPAAWRWGRMRFSCITLLKR